MSTSSKKGAHYEDCLVHCLTSCTLTLSDREVKKDSDLHQKMEHDLTKKKNKTKKKTKQKYTGQDEDERKIKMKLLGVK
jgi:hypothetical protein